MGRDQRHTRLRGGAGPVNFNGDCTLHMAERWGRRGAPSLASCWVGELDGDGLADVVLAGKTGAGSLAWVVLSGG